MPTNPDGRPTKTDLLKVLKSLGNEQSANLTAKRQTAENANGVLEDWLKENAIYQRLKQNQEEASDEFWRAKRAEDDIKRDKIRTARNRLLTDGPTPEVVNMVKRLAEEFR